MLSLTREGLKPRSIVYGLGLTINDKGGVGANTIQKRGKDALSTISDAPSMTREGLERDRSPSNALWADLRPSDFSTVSPPWLLESRPVEGRVCECVCVCLCVGVWVPVCVDVCE